MNRQRLLLITAIAAIAAIAALVAAGALWYGVRRGEVNTTGPVHVAWSAHTAARFEPCGCTAGMNGGLLRRAALLAQENQSATLSFEGGGWSAGAADHLQLRTTAYLNGLAAAHVDALGLGRADVELGEKILQLHLATAATANLPIVCANLVNSNGQAVGLPLIHLQAGGITYAVTGVVPSDAVGAGLRASDPAEAVARVTSTIGAEPLIVLADLNEEALSELARAVPRIALLIGSDVSAPSQEPLAVGRTRIIYQANHGKAHGTWTWDDPHCRFTLLADTLPEDPAQRVRVAALQQLIATTPLAADQRIPLRDGQPGYSGPSACSTCHTAAATAWNNSRHAHSHAALIPRGYAADPDCLRCHVTGLGKPDGWHRTDTRSELGVVSCESCHGPGSEHVASGGKTSLPPASPATCVSCHDAENSPKFDFATYWTKIAHGK